MAGFSTDDEDGIVGINVTPLVDIMLVLLIIFMVASSYIVKESIEVRLPKAATGGETLGKTLALKLTSDGTLYLNDKKVSKAVIAAECAKVKDDPDVLALIAADKDVSHGRVTALIDFVRHSGVTNFAINISPSDVPDL